ncbi:MAG: hypothetical protein KKF88_06030 [Alphaproteobacteria bacterium]|nr:hypothetical protein [Alphaproteobacteria bacterium]
MRYDIDWGDAAGWVQAIGALLVIFYTAWEGQRQVRRERSAAARGVEAFLELVEGALIHASNAYAVRKLETPFDAVIVGTNLRSGGISTLEKLLETPLAAWPSAALFAETQRLNILLQAAENVLKEIGEHAADDVSQWTSSGEHWFAQLYGSPIEAYWHEREAAAQAFDEVWAECKRIRTEKNLVQKSSPDFLLSVRTKRKLAQQDQF